MGLFSTFAFLKTMDTLMDIARPTVIISSAPEQKAEPQKVETKKVERKDVKPEVTKHEYF